MICWLRWLNMLTVFIINDIVKIRIQLVQAVFSCCTGSLAEKRKLYLHKVTVRPNGQPYRTTYFFLTAHTRTWQQDVLVLEDCEWLVCPGGVGLLASNVNTSTMAFASASLGNLEDDQYGYPLNSQVMQKPLPDPDESSITTQIQHSHGEQIKSTTF